MSLNRIERGWQLEPEGLFRGSGEKGGTLCTDPSEARKSLKGI